MNYICYDGTTIPSVETMPDIMEQWNSYMVPPNTVFNPDGTVNKSGRDLRKERLEGYIILFTRSY